MNLEGENRMERRAGIRIVIGMVLGEVDGRLIGRIGVKEMMEVREGKEGD